MAKLIDMLKTNIPNLLKSPYYTEKRDAIVESQQKKQRDLLQRFEEEVAEEGFSVIQVQMGLFTRPDLIPVIEGQPIPFAKIEGLVKEKKIPKETLEKLRAKYEELTSELEDLFEKLKEIDEETRTLLQEVGRGGHHRPSSRAASTRSGPGSPRPKIDAYLDEVEQNLVRTIDLFKNQKKEEKDKPDVDEFHEYRVNLLVDNSDQNGAPVVIETNPNYLEPLRVDRVRLLADGDGPDRLHDDQGRLLPQGQRRLPRHQRPRRPGRARRLDDPQADPPQPDLRDPELPLDVPVLRPPDQAGAHQVPTSRSS